MSILNNNIAAVENQYSDSSKLKIRIALHTKYSTNKQAFGDWIFSNYKFSKGFRILEVGCGPANIWESRIESLPKGIRLTLSDFSQGMVDETAVKFAKYENVDVKCINVMDIPFTDNTFDVVIANMMLYHVPDMDKGLKEIHRVLKADGTLYSATYGEGGLNKLSCDILNRFSDGLPDTSNRNFTLQNGKASLGKIFSKVERLMRDDGLRITDANDLANYIYSLTMAETINIDMKELTAYCESLKDDGIIYIPKEYGIFLSRK